jgi:predicted GTPase
MSRWRIIVVLILLAAPVVFLVGVGGYYLWDTGLSFYLWWPMAACWAAGYLLAWYWQKQKRLLHPVDPDAPLHWTDRDRQAWQLVEARARRAAQLNPDRLGEMDVYVETAKEMSLELARFYHPQAADPMASLTIPEMLAVAELASHDLAELVDQYLPGGHLLTIRDWRLARQVTEWYNTASNVYWLVSALFSPVNTALRYVASQVGLSQPLQMLQENLLVWFYTAYVHRLGTYLIDLNSGRLKVGARRYRELLATLTTPSPDAASPAATPPAPNGEPEDQVRRVTVTLCGQVKTGKSSLVNALLGEQRAKTDVLPTTSEVTRYELQPEGIPTRLVLLDTVGYGHAGPKADQLRVTKESAQQSDLLLLVLHARNPARQADLAMLEELHDWFAAHPDLKAPPILAVLTHMDLLSPSLEWAPPYDWQEPTRPKEKQIGQAVAAVREQLGPFLIGIVPVCTAPERVYGIEEWVLPAVAEMLDEVHAVALLRCLRAEIDTRKVRRVFYQFLASGKQLVKAVWAGHVSGGPPPHAFAPETPSQASGPRT